MQFLKWTKGSVASAGLVLAACFAVSVQAQIVERPIGGDPIALQSGLVAGKTLSSGVRAYFGVPYASPPVRENRWRDPQPVAPWKGVWNADRKGPECMQVLRPHNINHYFGEEPTSEDCLYLNLWAPPVSAGSAPQKLPVMVWIYGGGFTIGSSGMANYDGAAMASKGVIFVNFNYRVGALGFLAHPELTAESPHRTSGDYATLDQIAALKWVQANIEKFGGDPGNVTILGQSAGAASVTYLQVSPLAKGLFHRAVTMSGSAVGARPMGTGNLASGEQTGLTFQAALKAKSLDEMRQMPADKILALQADCQLGCGGTIRVGPIVDGYVLPKSPAEIFAAGEQNDVPLITGFTRDESASPLKGAVTVADYQAKAKELFGDHAEAFLKLYPTKSDADVALAVTEAGRDAGMQQAARIHAQAQVKTGKTPAFVYMFGRKHPYVADPKIADQDPKTIGAYHTSDVPYWFQNLDIYNWLRPTREWTAWDRNLTGAMSDALIAFAKTGDPSTPTMKWPKYDPAKEQLVEFGDQIRLVSMNTKRLDFFKTVPAQQALPTVPGRPRD